MNQKSAKQKIESLPHLITGIFLMIKGFDKMQHHYQFIGLLITLFGVIIFAYYLYEQLSAGADRRLKLIVHIFECLTLLLTTYVFFREGKTYLPYATLLAALLFLVAIIIHLRKEKRNSSNFKQ